MEICSTIWELCQRCPKEESDEAAHLVVCGHSAGEWSLFGVGCRLRRRIPPVLYICVGTVLVETFCAAGMVDQDVADGVTQEWLVLPWGYYLVSFCLLIEHFHMAPGRKAVLGVILWI